MFCGIRQSMCIRWCISLGIFLLVFWCMAMAQINCDTQTNTLPLYDLGYTIIPRITDITWTTTTFWATYCDIAITSTYVVFSLLIMPFCCTPYWICNIRFTYVLTYTFTIRTLFLLSTHYPLVIPSINPVYLSPNTAWGAILIMIGIRTTQTDYMMSGHTIGWTLMLLFFWHYKKNGVVYTGLSILFTLFSVSGIILLIGIREHYTSDIMVSVVISTLSFSFYHISTWSKAERNNWWAVRFLTWIDPK